MHGSTWHASIRKSLRKWEPEMVYIWLIIVLLLVACGHWSFEPYDYKTGKDAEIRCGKSVPCSIGLHEQGVKLERTLQLPQEKKEEKPDTKDTEK